jgi:hypothetical protein
LSSSAREILAMDLKNVSKDLDTFSKYTFAFDSILRTNNLSLVYKPVTFRIAKVGTTKRDERPILLAKDLSFSTNPFTLRDIASVVDKSPEIKEIKQASDELLAYACAQESKLKLSKGRPNWTLPGVGVNSLPPPPPLQRLPISQLSTPRTPEDTDPILSGLLSRSSTATSDPGTASPVVATPKKGGSRRRGRGKRVKKTAKKSLRTRRA